jgi:hypothetical protein
MWVVKSHIGDEYEKCWIYKEMWLINLMHWGFELRCVVSLSCGPKAFDQCWSTIGCENSHLGEGGLLGFQVWVAKSHIDYEWLKCWWLINLIFDLIFLPRASPDSPICINNVIFFTHTSNQIIVPLL